MRTLAAFMRVFVCEYTLDRNDAGYRDDVLRVDAAANTEGQALFESAGVKDAAHGTALKALRAMYRAGELNDRIRNFRRAFLC